MARVNALNFPRECLELFDRLVVPDEEKRIASATELAALAGKDQKDHEEKMKELELEEKKKGKAVKPEDQICALATYSCKRLIKGMASGRGSARQGFSLALCELLKAVDKLETKVVLDLLDKSLVIEGSGKPKGGEIREPLLGRVFAYGALVQAGRLETIKLKAKVVSSLLEISSRKEYLSEISYSVVMEILKSLSKSDFNILCKMSPKLKEALAAQVSTCQIEMFQLALWTWKQFGKQKEVPEGGFRFCLKDYSAAEIFQEDFLKALCPSLLQATCTHPRVHSVWYDLLELVVPSFKKGKESTSEEEDGISEDDARNGIQLFWSIVVDDGLLQSSSERKYLAFELLKRLCPLLSASNLQTILSEGVLLSLKQNLKKEENYLHANAKKCVRYLYSLMKRDSLSLEFKSVLSISIKQFSTWVKGAGSTFQSTNESNAAHFKILRNLFYASFSGGVVVDGQEYNPHLLKRQQEILNQISNICKSTSIERDVAEEILVFLLRHAFFHFSTDSPNTLNLPDDGREAIARGVEAIPFTLSKYCFDCLVNVLASLSQRPKFSAAYLAIMDVLLKTQSELSSSEGVELARKYTGMHLETLDVLNDAKSKIEERLKASPSGEEGNSQSKKLNSLSVLVSHITLVQLGELESDLGSHAKDVVAIIDRAFVSKGPRKKRKLNQQLASTTLADDLQWNDVLLDLLLSLLSLPNQLIRKSVENVFSAFIFDITESGLQSMVEVLQQTIDNQDEDEDDEDDEDEDEDEDSSDDDDEDDDDEDVNMDDNEDKDLQFSLENSKRASMDVDEDDEEDDSDSDLDDEAMFKLDAMIAAQFQMRRQMNKKRRLEDLLHFKFRVLTLIEDYFKLASASANILDLIEMILAAILSSNSPGNQIEAEVLDNLTKIVTKTLTKCQIDSKSLAEINLDKAFGILDKAMNYITHINPKKREMAPTVEVIAHYILKLFSEIHRETSSCPKLEDIVKVYGIALDRFFVHQKKCVLKRDFFVKSSQSIPECGVQYVAKLASLVSSSRNDYLKVEASELMRHAFSLADKGSQEVKEKLQQCISKDKAVFTNYLANILSDFPSTGKPLLTALKSLNKIAFLGEKMKLSIWDKKHKKEFLEKLQDYKAKDSKNIGLIKAIETSFK